MKRQEDIPDELNYTTSAEANMAIIKAMGEIRFMQKMEVLMPLVGKELMKAGVDFGKSRCPECGQIDSGQTGEYPCKKCGLPILHDEKE